VEERLLNAAREAQQQRKDDLALVQSEVERLVQTRVGNVDKQIRVAADDARQRLRDELRGDMYSDIRDKVRSNILAEMRSGALVEMRADIVNEVRSEMQEQMEVQLYSIESSFKRQLAALEQRSREENAAARLGAASNGVDDAARAELKVLRQENDSLHKAVERLEVEMRTYRMAIRNHYNTRGAFTSTPTPDASVSATALSRIRQQLRAQQQQQQQQQSPTPSHHRIKSQTPPQPFTVDVDTFTAMGRNGSGETTPRDDSGEKDRMIGFLGDMSRTSSDDTVTMSKEMADMIQAMLRQQHSGP
jgi:PBP1b-binding outer membrane lipoprotein LpoB